MITSKYSRGKAVSLGCSHAFDFMLLWSENDPEKAMNLEDHMYCGLAVTILIQRKAKEVFLERCIVRVNRSFTTHFCRK